MTLALALAVLALALTLAVTIRVIRLERLRANLERHLDDRDNLVDRTIGDMRATMREYADDVNQIYEWAQGWAADDEQADRRADDQSPVTDPPDDPAPDPVQQPLDLGEPVEVLDVQPETPATSEAWPPSLDDPPTTEIPRVGAHRTDARATRAAGRALREGADEETTR